MSDHRTPAGTSGGGEFAPQSRPESDVSLSAADPLAPGKSGPGWAVYRTPKGASFNPWYAEVDVRVGDLSDFEEDEVVAKVHSLAAKLKAMPFYESDSDFEMATDALADARDIDEVDEALTEFYDWGDSRRVIVKIA